MFNELSENLKKILLDLEKYFAIQRIPEGIVLNKELYEKSQKQINELYNEQERDFIALIFSFNRTFIQYQALINHYQLFYPETKEKEDKKSQKIPSISTPEKEVTKDEKEIGFLGLPKPDAIRMGSNGGNVLVSDKLVDQPFKDIPKILDKRKDEFEIWIGQEELIHFKRLQCQFGPTDPIFAKIEKYFNPAYGKNGHFTPIDNKKRDELKLCFSVQITRTGYVILYLKNEDVEQFGKNFFTVFKEGCKLENEEIVKFLELFKASNEEKAFQAQYIHDAREIGPKKVVDKMFKGAHVRIKEVHSFTKKEWDAFIDYSDPFHPHIEGTGPADQVKNFMDLISGVPEIVSGLTKIDHVVDRIYSVVNTNKWGVGELSRLSKNNHQDQLSYLSEIEATNNNRSLQTQILLTGLSDQENKNYKLNLETISEIREYNDFAKDSFDKIIKPTTMLARSSRRIALNMSRLATNLGKTNEILQTSWENAIDTIEHRSNQTEQLIIDSSREIIDKIDSKIDALKITIKEIVSTEINSRSEALKLNLELILKKLNELPGLTTKELIKELQDESKVSSKTIYNYLTKLKKQDLIKEVGVKNGTRGRPTKLYSLSVKLLNKLKKK